MFIEPWPIAWAFAFGGVIGYSWVAQSVIRNRADYLHPADVCSYIAYRLPAARVKRALDVEAEGIG